MITKFKIYEQDSFKTYIKTYENKSKTEELLHLILDEIEIAQNKLGQNDYDDWFANYNFKKISIKKVQKLIDSGANVNTHDEDNNYGSLLMMTYYRHDFELMKCLIKNGANVNDVNSIGSTALYYYSSYDDNIIPVKYLIDHGANVNIPNAVNVLPLFCATYHKNFEVAILLLKNGSDVKCGKNDLSRWMKVKNYKFQKALAELHPTELIEIDPDLIHEDILKEYEHLFIAKKYNI